MNRFEHNGQIFPFVALGREGDTAFIWAHGWRQDHRSFLPLAESLAGAGRHYLVDFPGFGEAPMPQEGNWGVGDYAALARSFVDHLPEKRKIWIGHSFGCRVGIKLATGAPECLEQMVLIGAAGLPVRRPFLKRLRGFLMVRLFKTLKFFIRGEKARDRLRARFGSSDYRNAGPMRMTFLKVINENLSEDAAKIRCPVTLIYGADDTETPPDIGMRYRDMIPAARLHILPHLDHYSILGAGRHQVLQIIAEETAL